MSPTLKICVLAMALLLSYSGYGCAQYGQPANYAVYPYPSRAEAVTALYHRNAQKPLRGLFADGFTRTLTVLGGAQSLNSMEAEIGLLSPPPGFSSGSEAAIESETGYAISFAFGRRHNHRLRSEIELALRGNETSFEFEPSSIEAVLGSAMPSNEDDKIRAYSVMKNFITGFENTSRVTPYIGAGLGWSYIEFDAPSVDVDEGNGAFSYQAIGGVATTINSAADFIVEYRFFGTTEIDVDGIESSIAYRAHNLFLGVKFEY